MDNNSNFFTNFKCEYFPCHNVNNTKNFNCLFCYCPLYSHSECGGNYCITENGIKDCSNCTLPHKAESFQYIMDKLKGISKKTFSYARHLLRQRAPNQTRVKNDN